MELQVLTDLYPIKFMIKLWLIVYFLYFWKILKYFKDINRHDHPMDQ